MFFSNLPSIRLCSTFVRRIRLQEDIKVNPFQCREQMQEGEFLLFHKGKPFLDEKKQLKWFGFESARQLTNQGLDNTLVFLQINPESGKPQFAAPTETDSIENSSFQDMRVAIFAQREEKNCQLVTKAWSTLQWHRKTNFCSNCGTKLSRTLSGSQRNCQECKSTYYPTLSPVGIVLIASEDHSKVLLIRQPRYPPGMFSCVAGFVDAGESLEECVKREAAEEVGIEVDSVAVHSSQHWPFPSGSLMVGCTALTSPNSMPDIDKKELEDARWFNPEELLAALLFIEKNPKARFRESEEDEDKANYFVPPKQAIAHNLIKSWLIENKHYTE